MWVLCSLGRPDRIRTLVDSYRWFSGESDVKLVLYEKDKRLQEYLDQKWPQTWDIEIVPMFGSGPTYNEIFRRYPHEECYGFLADDQSLDVPCILPALEAEAGRWNVAYANDQQHGEKLCTMPCIGGSLVRALGYLAPRNLVHMAIDNSWHEIGTQMEALRYRADLTYTHLHPLFGKAAWDVTYERAAFYSFSYAEIFKAWREVDLPKEIERAKAARELDQKAIWA